MSASHRHTERVRAKREAIDVTVKHLDGYAEPGIYGELQVAYKMQDGVVQLVRVVEERTHAIASRKSAA